MLCRRWEDVYGQDVGLSMGCSWCRKQEAGIAGTRCLSGTNRIRHVRLVVCENQS